MRPLGALVHVTSLTPVRKTAGGLILPDGHENAVGTMGVARVITTGPSVQSIQVGDWVVFRDYLKSAIPVEGGFLLRVEDILATADPGTRIGDSYVVPED